MARGVSEDLAFSMPADMRMAWAIAAGEMIDGGEFDWGRMQWKERK